MSNQGSLDARRVSRTHARTMLSRLLSVGSASRQRLRGIPRDTLLEYYREHFMGNVRAPAAELVRILARVGQTGPILIGQIWANIGHMLGKVGRTRRPARDTCSTTSLEHSPSNFAIQVWQCVLRRVIWRVCFGSVRDTRDVRLVGIPTRSWFPDVVVQKSRNLGFSGARSGSATERRVSSRHARGDSRLQICAWTARFATLHVISLDFKLPTSQRLAMLKA